MTATVPPDDERGSTAARPAANASAQPPGRSPARLVRVALAVAIGAAGAWLVWVLSRHATAPRDVDPALFAARAVLDGRDPYPLVGPGRAFAFPWGLYYPPPAFFLLVPLVAALPLAAARAAFVGVSVALLAYAISRRGYARLPLFLSYCLLNAIRNAQWSPLLTALSLLPPAAGALYVTKPNLGLAFLLASRTTRDAVVAGAGAAALVVLGLVVIPNWPIEWLTATHGSTQVFAPVTQPGGFLVLLALLRWRRPEARLLAALACIPQTGMWYEGVPLFLVAETPLQCMVLAMLSWVAFAASGHFVPAGAGFTTDSHVVGRLMVVFLYLPCVAMVLRRPNAGLVPAPLERAAAWSRARVVRARAATVEGAADRR